MTTSDNFQVPQEHTLSDALDALRAARADTVTLPAPVFYGLSDLRPEQAQTFFNTWQTLPDVLRTRTARQFVDTAESNFEFHYDQLGLTLLQDPLPAIRKAGVELLWENEEPAVLRTLLTVLDQETNDAVKAELLNAVGRFLLLGEFDAISQQAADRAQQAALNLWNTPTESVLVRRRALEALSNRTSDNLRQMIRSAYQSNLHDMRVSAVYAMGRSCDPHWTDAILEELNSTDPELQYEAVRASGQIELEDALPELARLAAQSDDRELQEVSIWALGEIGGGVASKYLEELANTLGEDDPDLMDLIEDAIHNAQINLDLGAMFNNID
jgi:HEAT repeat protein